MKNLEELSSETSQKLADAIADRIVEKLVLECGNSEIERWAKNWLSGEDRTTKTARLAARVANDVYWAADGYAEAIAGFIVGAVEVAVCASYGDAAKAAYWAVDILARATKAAEKNWQEQKLKELLKLETGEK